ncbi:MAG: phosphopantetheine-binding protein, partial [Bryobacteraceae bacterium]
MDEDLRLVPVGVPGELLIGGIAVGRGYWNRNDLTVARFIPDPFGAESGARLYCTGDLARYRGDGAIEFLGRIDHQVKIRGFRIEPGEIEDALRSHPGVRDCVVLAFEERGVKRLVAYIVTDGPALPDADLRAHIRRRLPEYMVPALMLPMPALPQLPNGKLDRKALPPPSCAAVQSSSRPQVPRNAREQALAEIWRGVLGVEHVGIHDNFFALGGDSILSIQVAARASQVGLHLTLGQIFQYQTIAELAAVAGEAPAARIEFQSAGSFPLTPVQQWFLEQGQSDPAYFNQSVLLNVPADTGVEALRQAFRIVLGRHDALRLCFRNGGGRWTQEAERSESVPDFSVIEITSRDEEEVRAQIAAVAEEAERNIR